MNNNNTNVLLCIYFFTLRAGGASISRVHRSTLILGSCQTRSSTHFEFKPQSGTCLGLFARTAPNVPKQPLNINHELTYTRLDGSKRPSEKNKKTNDVFSSNECMENNPLPRETFCTRSWGERWRGAPEPGIPPWPSLDLIYMEVDIGGKYSMKNL